MLHLLDPWNATKIAKSSCLTMSNMPPKSQALTKLVTVPPSKSRLWRIESRSNRMLYTCTGLHKLHRHTLPSASLAMATAATPNGQRLDEPCNCQASTPSKIHQALKSTGRTSTQSQQNRWRLLARNFRRHEWTLRFKP